MTDRINEDQILAAMVAATPDRRAVLARRLAEVRTRNDTVERNRRIAVLGEGLVPRQFSANRDISRDDPEWLDKLAELSTPYHDGMGAIEAANWSLAKSAVAQADLDELAIQAVGHADWWSGQFGVKAHVARAEFLGRVASLTGAKIAAEGLDYPGAPRFPEGTEYAACAVCGAAILNGFGGSFCPVDATHTGEITKIAAAPTTVHTIPDEDMPEHSDFFEEDRRARVRYEKGGSRKTAAELDDYLDFIQDRFGTSNMDDISVDLENAIRGALRHGEDISASLDVFRGGDGKWYGKFGSRKEAFGGSPDKWYVFGTEDDAPVSPAFDSSAEANAWFESKKEQIASLGHDPDLFYVGTGFPDESGLTGHEGSRKTATRTVLLQADGEPDQIASFDDADFSTDAVRVHIEDYANNIGKPVSFSFLDGSQFGGTIQPGQSPAPVKFGSRRTAVNAATKFMVCPKHETYFAGMDRYRKAEFFAEGGTQSPCTPGSPCKIKPGTDLFIADLCDATYDTVTGPFAWGSNSGAVTASRRTAQNGPSESTGRWVRSEDVRMGDLIWSYGPDGESRDGWVWAEYRASEKDASRRTAADYDGNIYTGPGSEWGDLSFWVQETEQMSDDRKREFWENWRSKADQDVQDLFARDLGFSYDDPEWWRKMGVKTALETMPITAEPSDDAMIAQVDDFIANTKPFNAGEWITDSAPMLATDAALSAEDKAKVIPAGSTEISKGDIQSVLDGGGRVYGYNGSEIVAVRSADTEAEFYWAAGTGSMWDTRQAARRTDNIFASQSEAVEDFAYGRIDLSVGDRVGHAVVADINPQAVQWLYDDGMSALMQITASRRTAEGEGPWFCSTCNGQIAGGGVLGWQHIGPDAAESDDDHTPEPGGAGYSPGRTGSVRVSKKVEDLVKGDRIEVFPGDVRTVDSVVKSDYRGIEGNAPIWYVYYEGHTTMTPNGHSYAAGSEISVVGTLRTAAETGAFGWPLTPSTRWPGENALTCPSCGSSDSVILSGSSPADTARGLGLSTIECGVCGRKDGQNIRFDRDGNTVRSGDVMTISRGRTAAHHTAYTYDSLIGKQLLGSPGSEIIDAQANPAPWVDSMPGYASPSDTPGIVTVRYADGREAQIPYPDLAKVQVVGSRHAAAEGQTCAECGDAIAQTDGQWHHDNGEKHDHEATPGGRDDANPKEGAMHVAAFADAAEIMAAVDAGQAVKWGNEGYDVIRDSLGQYLIVCKSNGSTIGLTWLDGVTLNGKPEDFFISGQRTASLHTARMIECLSCGNRFSSDNKFKFECPECGSSDLKNASGRSSSLRTAGDIYTNSYGLSDAEITKGMRLFLEGADPVTVRYIGRDDIFNWTDWDVPPSPSGESGPMPVLVVHPDGTEQIVVFDALSKRYASLHTADTGNGDPASTIPWLTPETAEQDDFGIGWPWDGDDPDIDQGNINTDRDYELAKDAGSLGSLGSRYREVARRLHGAQDGDRRVQEGPQVPVGGYPTSEGEYALFTEDEITEYDGPEGPADVLGAEYLGTAPEQSSPWTTASVLDHSLWEV